MLQCTFPKADIKNPTMKPPLNFRYADLLPSIRSPRMPAMVNRLDNKLDIEKFRFMAIDRSIAALENPVRRKILEWL